MKSRNLVLVIFMDVQETRFHYHRHGDMALINTNLTLGGIEFQHIHRIIFIEDPVRSNNP